MTRWRTNRPAQNGSAPMVSEAVVAPTVRRRWPIVLAALLLTVVVVTALLVAWWIRDGGSARPAWQQPAQVLLPSMRVPPMPGWRIAVTDLGLPAATPGLADGSSVTTEDDPSESTPFVGYVGERAFFVARKPGTSGTQWWLIGVNVRDGSRLFEPVPLDIANAPPDCFVNRPTMLFCLRDDGDLRNNVDGGVTWVIDARAGKVSYFGPTDLRTYPGELNVRQVGIYAVAESMDEGVYGVGATAEPTWFIPGDGSLAQNDGGDGTAPPFAIETPEGRESNTTVVFSLVDGSVVAPTPGERLRQLGAQVYPGGFAVEMTTEEDRTLYDPDEIWFFDNTGKRVGQVDVSAELARSSPDVPIVASSPESIVYSVDGRPIAEVPHVGVNTGIRLAGARLFVDESESPALPRWAQYDLTTGVKGKTCEFDMSYRYLGTDGSVGVFRIDNPAVDRVAKAVDFATCGTLWELPSKAGSYSRVWRIDTTLVQLSDDGTELMSLVPPSLS